MITEIFATRSDLMPGIEWIESQKNLQYSKTGLFRQEEINIFYSIKDYGKLGLSTFGNRAKETAFLVLELKHKMKMRKVPQKKGGHFYAIDQLENPNSIIFQPSGVYNDKFIIIGNIGTVSKTKESKQLYDFFKKAIVKGFTKVKGAYIGPEAMKLMNSGVRLITIHADQSPEYDLAMT